MRRILIMAARIAGPILLTKLMRGRKRKRAAAHVAEPNPHVENQIDVTPDRIETKR